MEGLEGKNCWDRPWGGGGAEVGRRTQVQEPRRGLWAVLPELMARISPVATDREEVIPSLSVSPNCEISPLTYTFRYVRHARVFKFRGRKRTYFENNISDGIYIWGREIGF